jgi:hydroxymethylpyrimidine/phosphomethylpyrimidine kinase
MKKSVLTIAASDPSGGAGIEADLKVFTAHQVFGLTAITAITLQDSGGVRGVTNLDPDDFRRTLEILRNDQPIAAIKIGALATLPHLQAVHDFLANLKPLPPVVFDPVFRATSGAWLCSMDAVKKVPELLFPFLKLITPNLPESGILAGSPVRDRQAMRQAAQAIVARGPQAALVKGGHVPTDSFDVLCYKGEITEWPNDRLPHEFHGTGCVLASAITARLALGLDLVPAIQAARDYLRLAMQRARPGSGDAYLLDFPIAQ